MTDGDYLALPLASAAIRRARASASLVKPVFDSAVAFGVRSTVCSSPLPPPPHPLSKAETRKMAACCDKCADGRFRSWVFKWGPLL